MRSLLVDIIEAPVMVIVGRGTVTWDVVFFNTRVVHVG